MSLFTKIIFRGKWLQSVLNVKYFTLNEGNLLVMMNSETIQPFSPFFECEFCCMPKIGELTSRLDQ